MDFSWLSHLLPHRLLSCCIYLTNELIGNLLMKRGLTWTGDGRKHEEKGWQSRRRPGYGKDFMARAAERNLPMRRVRLPPRGKGFLSQAYIISLRGVVVLVYYLTL